MPPDVHEIEPVTVPTAPVDRRPAREASKGATAGLALALVLLIVLEHQDMTLRDRKAISRASQLPVLGSVLTDARLAGRGHSPVGLVAHEQPDSPTAEAIREVRTALNYARDGSGPSCFLITSSGPGEGKTTIAANLAISLAQVGEQVLLVDTDLRRPQLAEAFGLDPARGLSRLLTDDDTESLVQACAVPNLHVMTSGPLLANPAEFLCSARFQMLLQARKADFDRIILDTPPVNVVTDVAILARVADSVLLMVRERWCTESALEMALEKLSATGVKFAGVVVNDAQPSALPSYYGGYYDYRGYSRYRRG
jgi:capsular exopolysaccharide synthesis family protein